MARPFMFNWPRRTGKTRSTEWAKSLPKGPLVQHLTFLHSLLLHIGADGDVLIAAEHSLREIAVYTQVNERYPNRKGEW